MVQKSGKNQEFEPMTAEELNRRIDISIQDSREGRLITSQELKGKMELEIDWTVFAELELV